MSAQLFRILGVVLVILIAGVPAGAWAKGAPPGDATKQQSQAATKAFQAAKKLLDKGEFQAALDGFRESYEAVASPNSQLMIVRALVGLGRVAEAYQEAESAAKDAEELATQGGAMAKYTQTATALRKEVDDLRAKIGMLTVNVTGAQPGAEMTVAGKTVESSLWGQPMPLDPGTVTVTVTGFESKEVTIEAGGEKTVSFAPPKPKPEPDEDEGGGTVPFDRLTVAIIAGGVGALGMISFGVFGGLATSKYSNLEDQCTDFRCQADLESDADQGRAFQVTANVSLVVGIVGLAAGTGLLVWYLVDPDEGGEEGEGDKGSEGDEGGEGELDSLAIRLGPGSVYLDGRF